MGRPTKTQRAEIAVRRQRALDMRAAGQPWATIAEQLGYSDAAAACKDVSRALDQRAKDQALAADHLRAVELEHLERLRREVLAVLERRHVTVSGGKIVYDGDEPLLDDAPVLAAVDRLVKIQERIARLQGLDSPVRVDETTTVRYVVDGVDLSALR